MWRLARVGAVRGSAVEVSFEQHPLAVRSALAQAKGFSHTLISQSHAAVDFGAGDR